MKQQWFPVGKDLMQGELSPFNENRPLTPLEAMLDLIDMASGRQDWTIRLPMRKLAERWKWNYHQKVWRFLRKCKKIGAIRWDKSETETYRQMYHITVVPPSGYTGGRTAEQDRNGTRAGHLHYNRKRDIRDSSDFSEQDTVSSSNQVNQNPQLEFGGGVRGIVSPWDLRQLREKLENDNGN